MSPVRGRHLLNIRVLDSEIFLLTTSTDVDWRRLTSTDVANKSQISNYVAAPTFQCLDMLMGQGEWRRVAWSAAKHGIQSRTGREHLDWRRLTSTDVANKSHISNYVAAPTYSVFRHAYGSGWVAQSHLSQRQSMESSQNRSWNLRFPVSVSIKYRGLDRARDRCTNGRKLYDTRSCTEQVLVLTRCDWVHNQSLSCKTVCP